MSGVRPASRHALLVMPLAERRGGGEAMLIDLLEQGQGQGWTWHVAFLRDGPMVEEVRQMGVSATVIDAGRLRQPHRMARAVARLTSLARTTAGDVIVSWMGKGQLYGGLAAWRAGIPAVWYQLGWPDPPGWQDRLATRLPAIGIMTCSHAAAAAQAKVMPVRPIRVVHPGADLSRFDPDRLPGLVECRGRLVGEGVPAEGRLIGIVGRLQRWKGMHTLISAMPILLNRYPDLTCVIVGGEHGPEPDYPDELRSLVQRLGVEGRVFFAGLRDDVPVWMNAMEVVVHASSSEPFGIVVAEAMALGKAVVATDTAGPTEMITPGVHGQLTPFGDEQALASAIGRYLDDPSFASACARRARDRAATFSTTRYAGELMRSLDVFLSSEPNGVPVSAVSPAGDS